MFFRRKYPNNKNKKHIGKVYAGPPVHESDDADNGQFEEVYAGPEFFEDPEPGVENTETVPEDMSESVTSAEKTAEVTDGEDAGAGSEPDSREDIRPYNDMSMFMAVYAGPQYFSDIKDQRGVYIPPEQMAEMMNKPFSGSGTNGNSDGTDNGIDGADKSVKCCHECGTPLKENAKFCHECGTQV